MKKLALIMIFSVSSVVLSAEEYTIQTISAQKEGSITSAFEKKVHASTLSSIKIKEGNCSIVTVGKYLTTKAAQHDLKKAKMISKDAFIRTLHRKTPLVCDHPTPEHNDTVHTKNLTVATVKSTLEEIKEVKSSVPAEAKEVEACKVQPCDNVSTNIYLYDRNIGRKNDLHEALEYYKNSQYHSFYPVALQNSK
ncbi:hypothetical protein [Sulfuricurvum sp.]|uniref:hypothetical protein n=1 Tax=Sulfuricurvum sp. TaxID=2025608 RepID=UPI003BB6AED9